MEWFCLIKRETVWKLFSCDDVLSFSLVMSKNYSHCDIQSCKTKGKYWEEGKYHRITIWTVWPHNDSNSLTHSWITALFVYPWFIFNIRNARIFIPYLFGCRVNHFKEARKKPNIKYVFISNGWKVRFLFSWVPPYCGPRGYWRAQQMHYFTSHLFRLIASMQKNIR